MNSLEKYTHYYERWAANEQVGRSTLPQRSAHCEEGELNLAILCSGTLWRWHGAPSELATSELAPSELATLGLGGCPGPCSTWRALVSVKGHAACGRPWRPGGGRRWFHVDCCVPAYAVGAAQSRVKAVESLKEMQATKVCHSARWHAPWLGASSHGVRFPHGCEGPAHGYEVPATSQP